MFLILKRKRFYSICYLDLSQNENAMVQIFIIDARYIVQNKSTYPMGTETNPLYLVVLSGKGNAVVFRLDL